MDNACEKFWHYSLCIKYQQRQLYTKKISYLTRFGAFGKRGRFISGSSYAETERLTRLTSHALLAVSFYWLPPISASCLDGVLRKQWPCVSLGKKYLLLRRLSLTVVTSKATGYKAVRYLNDRGRIYTRILGNILLHTKSTCRSKESMKG